MKNFTDMLSKAKAIQEKMKEVQDQIASFREQERKTRRELREVRKILKQDIEELGNNLLLANLLIVPGFVGILGFLFYRSRTNGVRT